MTFQEFANKWDRDVSNNFAIACFEDNSIEELTSFAIAIKNALPSNKYKIVDQTDMMNWGIKYPDEWINAIFTALHERQNIILNEK